MYHHIRFNNISVVCLFVCFVQSCGGGSEQPRGRGGNICQFLQPVAEHPEGGGPVHHLHGAFTDITCYQTAVTPSSWFIHVTLSFFYQLEEKVLLWQSSPASSLNPWFSSASCWSELVLQALQFLAGETKGKK